ncbi:MAG TPA: retroviral-like aspartic protease family protein [Novosphingobium sp.]|nr:retroviral-like aspartic protease family protein [Novosphingobium sp.]
MPIPSFLLPLAAFGALALPQIHGASGAQEATDVDIVAARNDQHERMTVPVRIADQPFRFLIDTGAQNTVLSTAVAAQLALPMGRKARLIGVAGSQIVDTVEVDQIDLGRRSFYGIIAPLLESGDIGADGIVGLDSLQDQRVLLDFGRKLMAIGDAKALGGNRGFEIVVTARRRSGQLIMTNARIDGVETDVVIDTGAETSIGNRALQRALSRRRQSEQTTLYSVTGQQIVADLGLARQLVIGDMRLQNVQIAYADAPPFEALDLARRPAILLGMRDLRGFDRVAIDFSTRKVMFDLPPQAF